jgi:Zn-dependent protease
LNVLITLLASLLALVLGITIHEFSHALSADLLGDPTARYQGRLTLNPVAHFDPIGGLMILMSSVTGFGFGWGKPVPVNPVNLRFGPRVGMALTAFAGPFSNIVLATLFAAPLRIAYSQGVFLSLTVQSVLWTVVSTNVALAVFNMLPIHPLDGSSILRGILSTIRTRWAYDLGTLMDRMVVWGPWIFISLIALDRVLPLPRGLIWTILGPFYDLLMRLILG